MRWRFLTSLTLIFYGCTYPPWVLPQDPAIKAGDRRSCGPPDQCVDLVIAIDTSVSFATEAGASVGFWSAVFSGPPEAGPGSTLWVALDGLGSALAALDPASTGVALIGFAGPFPYQNTGPVVAGKQAGWVEAELTNDFAAVEAAADRLRARGANGASCHACAVTIGGSLLARSETKHRCPVLLLLTDTEATLPYGTGFMAENERQLAKVIREVGIADTTLVAVGPAVEDADEAREFERVVSEAGARLIIANGSDDVAGAITGAVTGCHR